MTAASSGAFAQGEEEAETKQLEEELGAPRKEEEAQEAEVARKEGQRRRSASASTPCAGRERQSSVEDGKQ